MFQLGIAALKGYILCVNFHGGNKFIRFAAFGLKNIFWCYKIFCDTTK